MKKLTCRINCQKEAASEAFQNLKSKLKEAVRLSDKIRSLKEEPSFMTEEDIREEERMTNERLLAPKKIIEEIKELESHPDYIDPDHMEIVHAEIEKNRSILKSAENMSEDGTSKGN
jgi:hypothetical protein